MPPTETDTESIFGTRAFRPRILLADREKEIRDILVVWLFQNGFDCREAEDGQEAIDLLATGIRIDVVLSCLLMERVDGLSLLLHVKKYHPHIPFAVVTAITDVGVRDAALREGADEYLLKPFTFAEFSTMIYRLLGKRGRKTRDQRICYQIRSRFF